MRDFSGCRFVAAPFFLPLFLRARQRLISFGRSQGLNAVNLVVPPPCDVPWTNEQMMQASEKAPRWPWAA